jgi:hypothetical protein
MEMTDERSVAIDVAWGAEFFRDPADWHLFAVQLSVAIFKTMHRTDPCKYVGSSSKMASSCSNRMRGWKIDIVIFQGRVGHH